MHWQKRFDANPLPSWKAWVFCCKFVWFRCHPCTVNLVAIWKRVKVRCFGKWAKVGTTGLCPSVWRGYDFCTLVESSKSRLKRFKPCQLSQMYPNVTGQKYRGAMKILDAEILGMLRSCNVLLPLLLASQVWTHESSNWYAWFCMMSYQLCPSVASGQLEKEPDFQSEGSKHEGEID